MSGAPESESRTARASRSPSSASLRDLDLGHGPGTSVARDVPNGGGSSVKLLRDLRYGGARQGPVRAYRQ